MKTLNTLAVEHQGCETARLTDLSVDELKNTGGGDWTDAVGCGAGMLMVLAAAGSGGNIFAFVTGVLAINEYC